MTEVFKYLNGIDLVNEVSRLKSNYHNLTNLNQFAISIAKTKSSLNRANQLLQLVPPHHM